MAKHPFAACRIAITESPASMHYEIHQYYGTFGFSLAIVTQKTYNEFQGRSVDGIESPQRLPARSGSGATSVIVRRLMRFNPRTGS